jgi:hypothetical protein
MSKNLTTPSVMSRSEYGNRAGVPRLLAFRLTTWSSSACTGSTPPFLALPPHSGRDSPLTSPVDPCMHKFLSTSRCKPRSAAGVVVASNGNVRFPYQKTGDAPTTQYVLGPTPPSDAVPFDWSACAPRQLSKGLGGIHLNILLPASPGLSGGAKRGPL